MKTIKAKDNELGSMIKSARRKAGITQKELGKRIGLGEARVSKIENGAPITPETASYILSKLGSKLQLKVVNYNLDRKDASFVMESVYNYSKAKGISLKRAYQYLKTFNGLSFLSQYAEIEKTLSFIEVEQNLSRICAKNGGAL